MSSSESKKSSHPQSMHYSSGNDHPAPSKQALERTHAHVHDAPTSPEKSDMLQDKTGSHGVSLRRSNSTSTLDCSGGNGDPLVSQLITEALEFVQNAQQFYAREDKENRKRSNDAVN